MMAIIALVATLVIAYLGMNRAKGRDAKRVNELNSLRDALQIYYMDHGYYPTSTAEESECYIGETNSTDPNYCDGLYNEGDFVLSEYIQKLSDPLFGKSDPLKNWAYRYMSTSSGTGYKLHADLESDDYYEIVSGGWTAGEVTPPPPPKTPPTVITKDATNIEGDSSGYQANLNGEITDTGGETAFARGFVLTSELGYSNFVEEGGAYGVGSFSHLCEDLTPGTTFHFKAWAENTEGMGEGSELSFTTGAPALDTFFEPSIYDVFKQHGPLEVVVKLEGPVSQTHPWPVRVQYSLAFDSGTAIEGTDYSWSGPGTVTFNAGKATTSFSINVLSGEGGDKNLRFELVDAEGAVIVDPSIAIVNIMNNPPDANNDSADVNNGGSVEIPVLNNDSDIDGHDLEESSVIVKSPPFHGVAIPNPSGTITYTHDGGKVVADDYFTYTVKDEYGAESNEASVAIGVNNTICDSCANCNALIQSTGAGGTVTLQNDIWNTEGDCIEFNSKDNIIFDCNNYTIDGDGDNDGFGIRLYPNSDGNVIKNCNIRDFHIGIYAFEASSNYIENADLNNNGWGLHAGGNSFTGPVSFDLDYVDASNNDYDGIVLHEVDNSNFSHITTYNNGQAGMSISSCEDNIFSEVDSRRNDGDGMDFSSSHRNNLNNISLIDNYPEGLYLSNSRNNSFSNSTISNNQFWDVMLYMSSGSYCDNTFNNVIGTNGLPIRYYSSAVNLNGQTFSELLLCNADGSSLNNITIDASGNNGLWFSQTDNTSVVGLNSSGNNSGVWLRNSDYNNFQSIVANNNRSGFAMRDCSNNSILFSQIANNPHGDVIVNATTLSDDECIHTLTDVEGTNGYSIELYHQQVSLSDRTLSELILCNADHSDLSNITIDASGNNGLYVLNTERASFSNVNSSGNGYGLYMHGSHNNNFRGFTANSNSDTGVGLSSCDNNVFEDFSINSNNCWGFKQFHGVGNVLKDSNIEGTRNNYYYECGGLTFSNVSGNEYYNNVIYNSAVPDVVSWSDPFEANSWSTSPQTGPNIVGGPHIGGNYWRKYSSCNDYNGDGFCDLPYDVEHGDADCSDTNNCDNYPLKR